MNLTTRMVIPAAVAALAISAAPAMAWTSNSFRSPSGNIGCQFVPADAEVGGISCWTRNDGWTETVARRGAAYHYRDARGVRGPVLQYGGRWDGGWAHCTMQTYGVRCWSSTTGHGFALSKTQYKEF